MLTQDFLPHGVKNYGDIFLKKVIKEKITLPKYDCIERFYEETKETQSGERTARDIRKSYYK